MGVIGSDSRKVITSFSKFPYSAITILDTKYKGAYSIGTGITVAPNHILTAAHNTYEKGVYTEFDGTRATISSEVNGPNDLEGFFNPSKGETNVTNINYLADFDNTEAPEDDIALLTTSHTPIAAKDAIGIIAFANPETAKGFTIQMAGYASDNVEADIEGNSGKAGRDLVLSPKDGLGKVVGTSGKRFYYSPEVDAATGMSGAGVWHTLEGDDERVLGVHAYGLKSIPPSAAGFLGFRNSGALITTGIYDKIMTQIEADSGTGNADELPENAIIGSDNYSFSEKAGTSFKTDGGNDYIHGSYRKERILGRSGNDRLFGGGGDDRLEGGEGVDQALFSDEFANYKYTITDPSNPAFEFLYKEGTTEETTDKTKDIEFGVFEFEDTDRDGIDDDKKVFYVPLQVDPEDNTKLKDGAIITPEKDIFNKDGEKIGTITVESPAWMFDGDVRYTLNIGSEQGLLYNFAYIIDTSGSMSGTPLAEAKTAYQTLTQSLMNTSVAGNSDRLPVMPNSIAGNSEFAVIPFNSSASLIAPLSASSAISTIDGLSADGGTYFGDALTKAQEFFTSPSRNNSATNIAYFLSDGYGSGASASLQSVAEVRAFGIGGADLSTLNIIDSDNAVLLSDPADLVTEFNTSTIDKNTIERIDVKLGVTVVDTITPEELVENTLGLQYKGTIEDLEVTRTAQNEISFDVVFKDDTPTASLDYKITTGQEEVKQQTNDGEKEVNIFGVNQTDFTGTSEEQSAKQEIIGNDLDNNIEVQNNKNTIFGNGGNDRFKLWGGVNLIDGGEGIDTVEINKTQAQAGGVSKSGNTVNIGTDNTLLNVEFIQFSDVRLAVDTLAVTPTISLANQGILIAESNTGSTTATFTVNLSSTATEDVVIDFTTRSDDAEVGTDFVENTGQLTITAGETSGDITLEILDDTNVEGNETLFLDLSVVSGGTFANGGITETAGVKILDDDSVITIPIAGDDTTVIEGNSGTTSTLTLNLNRFGGLLGSDTVEIEIIAAGDNPAQASDFVGGFSSQQVTFAPDEDTKTIDISINPDQQIEGDETFGVRLTSVSGSALVPSEELIFTILDDDEQIIAGNTLNDALQITLNGNGTTQTFTDSVGSTDTNDYYSFTLGSSSDFNLELNGLSDDADVQLLDSSGEVIVSPENSGTTAELINQTLDAGDYYIRVLPWEDATTSYNLNVSATAFDFAGNTINDARQINLNGNGTTQILKDWVGSTDSDDYYSLTIGSSSDFNLELNGLSDDADVQLLDSSGEVIVSPENSGTTAELINQTLDAGDYYIRVLPWEDATTSYNLNVSATAFDFAGNTINDAYQINLNGNGTTRTFKEWVGSTDSDNYYRFSLGSTSDFNLELNGLSDDANVRLLDSNGDTIVGSYNYGTTAESINGTILPGDYYIHVNQAWGYDIDASYNLNVSVDAFN